MNEKVGSTQEWHQVAWATIWIAIVLVAAGGSAMNLGSLGSAKQRRVGI